MTRPRILRYSIAILAVALTPSLGCKKEEVQPTGRPIVYPVKVGPSETQVDPETQSISMSNGDMVQWTLFNKDNQPDQNRKLYIEFERPDAFAEVTLVASVKRFRAACQAGTCKSGPISKNATPGMKYKYWQVVVDADGTEHAADGHIIINR